MGQVVWGGLNKIAITNLYFATDGFIE